MVAHMQIPTVKIATDITAEGYMIINESDFDPETMTIYGSTSPEASELETATEREIATNSSRKRK